MEKNVEGGGGGGRGLGGGGDKSEGSSSSSSASTNQPRLFGHQEFSPGERQIVRELLQKKLGKEHLATRPGAAGSHYTYVESWKAIEIANQIFGFNGWSCSVVDIVPDYIEETRQGRYSVGVTAIVKVCLKDGTYHEDVGYGMSEHPKKGSAIEHAKKEAVSDARKRALRLYGNALGNCLYDKQHLTKLKSSKKGEAGFLEESPVNPYVSNSINGYSTTALSQMQPPAAPSAAHNPHDLSAAKGFAPPTAYPQPPQLQNITSPYQPSQTGYGQSSPSSSTSSSTGINNKPYSFTSPQPQQQHGSYSQGPSFTQQQQQQQQQPSNSSVGSVSQSLPLKTTVDVQQPQQGGINSAPHFSPTIRTAPSQMNNSTNPYYSQQQGLPPLSQDSTDAHLLESLSADSQATPVPPYSRGKRGYEATATPLSQQQSQPISSTAPPGISTASGSGGYSNNNHSYSQPNNNYPSSSSSSFSQQQHHQGSSSGSPPASSAMGSNNSGGGKSFPPPSFGLRDITPPEKRLRT